MKKLGKITALIAGVLFLLLATVYVALHQPSVQTWLARQAASYLSNQWNTNVQVKNVSIDLFERFHLENVYIEDHQQDTLLHASRLSVELNTLNLLNKQIGIEHIGLSKGKLYISRKKNRRDYNFHFIAKAFASEASPPNREKTPWQLNLQSISLDQIEMQLNDERENNNFNMELRNLAVEMNDMSMAEKTAELQSLTIEGMFFHYTTEQDTAQHQLQMVDNQQVVVPVDTSSSDQFLPEWNIGVTDVRIANSTFRLDNESEPPMQEAGIDYHHLHVSNINLSVSHLTYSEDTLQTKINSLSLLEQSGFAINNLSSDFLISNKGFRFQDLSLVTDNSHIRDYVAMNYESFSDFKDFTNRVVMHGKFKDSKVDIKDVNYFAHELDPVEHNTVQLNGEIQGEMSHLNGEDLRMKLGQHSIFDGNFSLRGLPDVEETFITLWVEKLSTTAQDISRVYPEVRLPAEVHRMGRMVFSGAFDGFYNDFVAEGTLQSALGQLESDLNFKFNKETYRAGYRGNLSAKDFNAGRFFDQEKYISRISFHAKLQGQGLSFEKIEARLDTDIDRLELNGYQYEDIELEGGLEGKLFSGDLTINDENIGLDFNGHVNFKNKLPTFQATATIDSANLQALKITQEEYLVQSTMRLDFKGQSIDDLLGDIGLYQTKISKNAKTYELDTFRLVAQKTKGLKEINLHSNLADAELKGDFAFREMTPVLENYFNYYFHTKLKEETTAHEHHQQQLQFNIRLKKTDGFTDMFLPKWKLPATTTIDGSFNSKNYNLVLNTMIPEIHYQNAKFNNIQLKGLSNEQQLNISSNVDSITFQDSLYFQDISLSSSAINDSVNFSIDLTGASAKDRINFNGLFSTEHDSFIVAQILPSTIFLNDKKWKISQDNHVRYSPGKLSISDFIIRQDSRKITLESFVNGANETIVSIGLENIELADFTHPFIKDPDYQLRGQANGNIRIADVFSDPMFISSLRVQDVSFNRDTIGDLKLISNYQRTDNSLYIDLDVSGERHQIRALGNYNLSDKETNQADIDINISKISLSSIEKYVDEEVTNISGYTQGNLRLTGNFNEPVLTGSLAFHNAAFTVNYLNTHYKIDDQQVSFDERWLDLQQMTVEDAKGNTASLGGQIFHNHLRNFSLDVYLFTDRFQFLNTTLNHNQDYFGTAYGNGTVLFQGPFDDIELFISAKTSKNTTLSIPVSGSEELESSDFYRFINTEESKNGHHQKEEFATNTNYFRLNFDLEITPDALMRIIFDLKAGDIIKARGFGNMKMLVNSFGDFEMVGTYQIQEGDYLFTFQNIVNKKFLIESGGKIIWTGNPYEARLDLNAIYELRTAPYPLIAELVRQDQQQVETAKDRVPVDLYLQLSGSLLSPTIGFDIRMPEAPPSLRSSVESELRAIKQNENELNRQVFGLLVLNNFIPDPNRTPTLAAQTSPDLTSGVNNTVSEFLSNQVSLYFSDWFSRFVTEMEFDISYRQYDVGEESVSSPQNPEEIRRRKGQEVQVELSKKFMNDRIAINVGGNVDIDNSTSAARDDNKVSNIASDFIIEYDIQKDGKVKVKAFRKTEYDVFSDENENKTGIGIFYREEFDTFGELMRKLIGSKKTKEEEKPPKQIQ